MGIHRRQSGAGHRVAAPGLLAILFLLILAGPAWAALWYENYEDAETALEAGNWAEAIDLLEQALAQKGESGARVRTYGMNFVAYFPYLKLGVANFRLGNHDAALAWLTREEALGEVQKSPGDLAELQRIRDAALQARDTAVAGDQQRVVNETIGRARALEQQGRLEEALGEFSKVLTLDLENEEASTAVGRIQGTLENRRKQREEDARFARLLEDGRRLLTQQNFQEAAAVLREAVSLKPGSEADALLGQAQDRLSAKIRAERSAAQRAAMITDGLERAEGLERAGDLAGALQELQTVLAIDPGNAVATSLESKVLVAQERATQQAARNDALEALLDEIERSLGTDDYDAAMTLAARALVLDSANQRLQEYLRRISLPLRQQLLGGKLDFDPLIVPINYRKWVWVPEYRLVGQVFSATPVVIEFDFSGGISLEPTTTDFFLEDGQRLTQFRFQDSVPLGRSLFRVVATDRQGRSQSAEYPVRYVPWYLLVFAGILGPLAAVMAVLYGRRWLRRRRLFKRRFNPYIAGAPVLKDDLFFGREPLISRVLQTVHNNSILLYGERRIGKTSFQHHLRRRLKQLQDPDYRFYPVFIDLQGTPEEKFFSTLAEDVFEQLGPELDGLAPNPALHGEGGYTYKEFIRDIRNVLKTLKAKNEKKIKVVLLIDEVDELNAYDPKINQKLRGLFMRSFAEDLVAVVSGVGIKKQWDSEGSPWYNFFEEIPVAPFRKEDAEELIRSPIRGIFTLEPGVVDRIVSLTDCKPYLIQKLCVALVNRLHDEKRRRITVSDVDTVARMKEV